MRQYKKIFIAGANGMLGTTLQNIVDTKDFLLTDEEIFSIEINKFLNNI